MSKETSLLLTLLLTASGAFASVPMSIGNRGSIVVPFYNNPKSTEPVEGVVITATASVSGLNILSTSFSGPVSVFPGCTTYFHVDFEIGAEYPLINQAVDITINLTHSSPNFVPGSRQWSYKTKNLFRTIHGECLESGNIFCGEYLSPDTNPPSTDMLFDGPEFADDNGTVFLATFTLTSFIGGDAYVEDSDISGVAITGYAYDSTPNSFEDLTVFADPILLSEGQHALYFASRDNAGNTEVIKSTVVYVDGTAPVTALEITGSSYTDVDGNLVIPPAADVSFISQDAGSGPGMVYYSVDAAEYSIFAGTFSLSVGTHTVSYYSVDNVGNAEVPHSVALTVRAPVTAIWSGLGLDGNWHNPANWRDNTVPGPGDGAIVATRETVIVDSTPLRVRDVILGDEEGLSAPILLISTAVDSSGEWTINRNATLTQGTTAQLALGTLTLRPGAALTHSPNTGTRKYVVNIRAVNDIVVPAGSSITVDGLGYAGGASGNGYGPGKGTGAYGSGGGGAGHGGQGGNGLGNSSGGIGYDSLVNPTEPGSGGGARDFYFISPGGAGGGVVILDVGGTLRLDGIITAAGANPGGGGGAGGAINIRTANLAGTGRLNAAGAGSAAYGGAGGGGRIAVEVTGEDTSSLVMTANSPGGYGDGVC